MSVPSKYPLFCLGHPLLDIQVVNGEELLSKYGLNADDGILAREEHLPIYQEIVDSYDVSYVAGGAAQNTARGAAYVLPPESVVFVGCVGDDEFSAKLSAVNQREGVKDIYQVKTGSTTGACAVVITGQKRSLVTALRAARELELAHLHSHLVAPYIHAARIYYCEGYLISHAMDILLHLGKRASEEDKIFALNFSAPYIPKAFSKELDLLCPYCDIIISNRDEAVSWAAARGHAYGDMDLRSIATSIATLPKVNSERPRLVILTSGADHTVWVTSNDPLTVHLHPVPQLKDEEIIDTNAAGDAFAGGFLGAFISGKTVVECIQIGHKLAAICVGQVGPQYKWPKIPLL